VLREEAGPALGVGVHLKAVALSLLAADAISGDNRAHGSLAFADDFWISDVEEDPQAVDIPRMRRDRAVPEI
jgi:hypothetical protein